MLKCRIISSRRRCRRHDPAPRADLSSSHRAEKLGHRPAGTRPPLLPFRGCDVRARTRTHPLRCRARPFPSIHLPISIVFKRVWSCLKMFEDVWRRLKMFEDVCDLRFETGYGFFFFLERKNLLWERFASTGEEVGTNVNENDVNIRLG